MAGSSGLLPEELRAVRSTRFVRGEGGFSSLSNCILGHEDVPLLAVECWKIFFAMSFKRRMN